MLSLQKKLNFELTLLYYLFQSSDGKSGPNFASVPSKPIALRIGRCYAPFVSVRAFLLFVQRCCLQFHSHMYRARGNTVCIASIVTHNSRLCTRSFVKLRTVGWHYVRVLTTHSVYLCLRHCMLMKAHFFFKACDVCVLSSRFTTASRCDTSWVLSGVSGYFSGAFKYTKRCTLLSSAAVGTKRSFHNLDYT